MSGLASDYTEPLFDKELTQGEDTVQCVEDTTHTLTHTYTVHSTSNHVPVPRKNQISNNQ
jgi:hypothetical protein